MTRHSKKHSTKSKKMIGCMMGGNGAAEFGVTAYGGIGQQNAVPGGGNLINIGGAQAALVPAVPVTEVPQTGGKKQQGGNTEIDPNPNPELGQDGGKTVIGDLLVPAALLYTSQLALKKNNSVRKGGKKGGRKSSKKPKYSRRSRRRL
jgi:hypothetical protein